MFNRKKSDNLISLTDSQLWELVTQGDRLAFEQLYRRYFSSLVSYGLSFVADEEVVKDCIQNLFIKLFQKSTSLSVTNIKAYLYSSLRNELFDHFKYEKPVVSIEEMVVDFPVGDSELDMLFAKDDEDLLMSRRLVVAFNQLNVNQRNAIYLYYIKKFTWDEMALAIGISSHSCMNLIARSIAKLRTSVGEMKNR